VSQHERYQKQQQKHSDATAAKHSNEPAQQQQGGEHHHEKTKRGKIGSFLCVVFARVETTRWICQEYQQQHQNRQWQSSENTQKLVASTTKEDGNSVQHKMIFAVHNVLLGAQNTSAKRVAKMLPTNPIKAGR